MSKKFQCYRTNETEGRERPAVLVIITCDATTFSYLCYEWGESERGWFFQTLDNHRIELYGDAPFIVQCPAPGQTFQLDGTARELRERAPVVVLQ